MGDQIQLPLPQVPLDASRGVAASNLLKRIKMESMYEPIWFKCFQVVEGSWEFVLIKEKRAHVY